jgi:hypothetical protein
MALSNSAKGFLVLVALGASGAIKYHLYQANIERSRQNLAAKSTDVGEANESEPASEDAVAPGEGVRSPRPASYDVVFTCTGPGGVSLQILHCLTSGFDGPTGAIKVRQNGDVRVFGVNDLDALSKNEIRQPLAPGFQIDAQNAGGDGTSLRMEIRNGGKRVYSDVAGQFEMISADEDRLSS